ncbi:MAG: hypothetical protein M1815_001605 [Lichina confinis]|nr:MAG: hypothetical protein M1815_001605 [Lichina confinis]
MKDTVDPATFTVIPSTEHPHRIEDKRGNLLAYRLRLPHHLQLIETLEETEQLIPKHGQSQHKRGLAFTKDYRDDNTGKNVGRADEWFRRNQKLFDYLGGTVLRNLAPRMYQKFRSVRTTLDPLLRPLCGVWAGCAINQHQTDDGKVHLDWKDTLLGLNTVVGWGDYETATLNLWQLGVALEVRKGDAVLFLGRILSHNAVGISGGARRRNIVDCFIHESLFQDGDAKVLQRKEVKRQEEQLQLQSRLRAAPTELSEAVDEDAEPDEQSDNEDNGESMSSLAAHEYQGHLEQLDYQ